MLQAARKLTDNLYWLFKESLCDSITEGGYVSTDDTTGNSIEPQQRRTGGDDKCGQNQAKHSFSSNYNIDLDLDKHDLADRFS